MSGGVAPPQWQMTWTPSKSHEHTGWENKGNSDISCHAFGTSDLTIYLCTIYVAQRRKYSIRFKYLNLCPYFIDRAVMTRLRSTPATEA